MNPRDIGKKRITIFVDPEVHKVYQAACAEQCRSMSATLQSAILAVAQRKVVDVI